MTLRYSSAWTYRSSCWCLLVSHIFFWVVEVPDLPESDLSAQDSLPLSRGSW